MLSSAVSLAPHVSASLAPHVGGSPPASPGCLSLPTPAATTQTSNGRLKTGTGSGPGCLRRLARPLSVSSLVSAGLNMDEIFKLTD